MKELSTEEKAKRYDDAIKVAKRNYDTIIQMDEDCTFAKEGIVNTFHHIFPELKESEDEIIRKWLIDDVKDTISSGHMPKEYEYMAKKAISWLEKQGEQIYPIFRVGDRIRNKKTYDEVLIEQLDMEEKVYYHKSFDGAATNHSDLPFSQQNEWEIIGQNITKKPVISDEAIREGIVHFGITQYQITNWLKKYIDVEKQDKKKDFEPKQKPKFNVGDWVINEQGIIDQIDAVVENVTNHTYGYDTINGEYFNDYTEGVRLWTIEDAKDGDVLATKKGNPFIYDKNRYNNGLAYYYAGLDVNKELTLKSPHNMLAHFGELRSVFPATEEQRDLLFKKMKEEGYEYYTEKKELNKIEQNPYPETLDKDIELYYYTYGNGEGGFNNLSFENFKDIVKTFVEDYGNKPKWTEEDENYCLDVNVAVDEYFDEGYAEELRDWLKSIKKRHNNFQLK